MSHPEPHTDPLAQLLRGGLELDDVEKRAARDAFLQRLDAQLAKTSGSRRRFVWVAPLVAAAAALSLFLMWRGGELDYEVAGAVNEGGYVRPSGEGPATIRFSDDTRLTADPGARLRINETHRNGASVSVEQGRIAAEVFHGRGSDWRFIAGPFQVQVTGTRFDLAWDARAERLEVVLHEGSVEVAGYSGSGPVAVRAGQRFVGDAGRRTMQVMDQRVAQDGSSDEETAGSLAARSASEETADRSPSPGESDLQGSDLAADTAIRGTAPPGELSPQAGPKTAGTAKASWSELVTRGDFQSIVTEAEARGASHCLARCTLADLTALADAARYTGRTPLAEQSLLALRRRFAQNAGTRAAFLLGRLHEHQGQHGQARTWYETSLREAPSGDFASESLAGKMRTVNALEGKQSASPIAREYLRRYPGGVHASLAKQLAGAP